MSEQKPLPKWVEEAIAVEWGKWDSDYRDAAVFGARLVLERLEKSVLADAEYTITRFYEAKDRRLFLEGRGSVRKEVLGE